MDLIVPFFFLIFNDFFLIFQPKEILRVNFRILKTFVAAMKYLMKQLKRLQGAEGLVTNELRSMKNHTKALINHLQKIVKIIVSVFLYFRGMLHHTYILFLKLRGSYISTGILNLFYCN